MFGFAEFAPGAAGIEAEVVGVVGVMLVGAAGADIQISAPAKDSGSAAPKLQKVQRGVAWVKRAMTIQNLRCSWQGRWKIAEVGVGVDSRFGFESEPKVGYAWGRMT